MLLDYLRAIVKAVSTADRGLKAWKVQRVASATAARVAFLRATSTGDTRRSALSSSHHLESWGGRDASFQQCRLIAKTMHSIAESIWKSGG